jgi:hypothetical protein
MIRHAPAGLSERGGWRDDFMTQTESFITSVQIIPERYQLMIAQQELAVGGDHQTVSER